MACAYGWSPSVDAEECLNLHRHVVDLLCRRELLQGVQGEQSERFVRTWIVPDCPRLQSRLNSTSSPGLSHPMENDWRVGSWLVNGPFDNAWKELIGPFPFCQVLVSEHPSPLHHCAHQLSASMIKRHFEFGATFSISLTYLRLHWTIGLES